MKFHCKTCGVVEPCKAAFGQYWEDKSRGGVGCEYKYPAEPGEPKKVRAAAKQKLATKIAVQKKFWCEEVAV